MENKEENTDTISSQTLINDNNVNGNENNSDNTQPPIIQINSEEININNNDNSLQSPSSSLNPILPDDDTSDIPDDIQNNINSDSDNDNDDDEEDYGTSNFLLYKKIQSNNNDPIQSLKETKPSKSILKVTNVQPQKNTFFKKDWFKEKFGTSGNTISSAFKTLSNTANMAIERQYNNLTNGQGTWKSKSSDSIYLTNYYNDSIGNTMAIDPTNRLNPEEEKNDICNSMDTFLGDIPKRVRFSFEDISTALANDENRLSLYQIQLQQLHQLQLQQRQNPLPISQRRDSLTRGHANGIKSTTSPIVNGVSNTTTTTTTTNVNTNSNPSTETQNNTNNNNTNDSNKLNVVNNDSNTTDSNNNNNNNNETQTTNNTSETTTTPTEGENKKENNNNNNNAIENEPPVVVDGIKEGDEVNLDEVYDEPEETEEEEKPKIDPKDKHPLTPAQILKAYEIEWKRRNERPIIPIINMLRNKINDNETTVPIIDIHDTTITKNSVISLADLLATRFGLETLNIENTGIVNDELKILLNSLLNIKTLRHLNVANNPKSSEGVKYISSFLRKNKKLRSLNISKLFINWELISYLSIALEGNTSLKLLVMNGCQVNYHDFLKMFAKGVHKSKLKYLCFKNNKFNNDCGEMLAHLINPYIPLFKSQDMTSTNGLTYVNLSNCRLKPCFYAFSKGLINNPTLKYLIIRNNNLEPSELSILSEILIQNTELEVLDISKNKKLCLDTEQVVQLKNALISNDTLTELYMAQTGLNSEGAISIAEIFPLNKTLRVLDLRLNPIEIAGVVALSVSLKLNHTITNLQLSQFIMQNENEIEPEFQRILYDILISCSRNMSANPYVEKFHLEEFKDLDIDQCSSPIETNEHFYQKFLYTPKILMKKNSNSSLSTRSSSANGSRNNSNNNNNFNNNNYGQGYPSTNGNSNLLPPQQPSDNHSYSSMDNNIDLSVDDEQLKHDTELAIKLSKEEEENRKLKENIESLKNNIQLLEQMVNSDSSEKEVQDIVYAECEKNCKLFVQRIIDESIKDEILSSEILALNDRYTVITEKLKSKENQKETTNNSSTETKPESIPQNSVNETTSSNETKVESTTTTNNNSNDSNKNENENNDQNKVEDTQSVDMIMEIDNFLNENTK